MDELKVINPFSTEVDRSYRMDSWDEVAQLAQEMRENQRIWRKKSLAQRKELVLSALAYFSDHRQEIAEDISRQMGRPLSQAQGEINGLLERAHYMIEVAEEALGTSPVSEKKGFARAIDHAPHGLIFVLSAWNYPLLITINSVVPALISGNVVMLKHSSQTPEIGRHFEKAFGELGDCRGLLKNLIISHQTSGRLIESELVDHVIFTGSVEGGKSVLKHCAESLISPNLELGGKDAAYVDEEVDLKKAVESIVDGAVFNSGQSCCGIERAYVHQSVYSSFIEEAKKLMSSYTLGDPMSPDTNLGPLVNARAAIPMEEQLKEALAGGAEVLTGGKVVKIGKAVFFPPTLVVGVKQEMSLLQEENFGPILPVMMVGDMSEAIEKINDSKFGLTSAIFTSHQSKAERFYQEVDTGTVFMNRCDYLDPALPWTGVRRSGCGSSLSKFGYMGVTRLKGKHFRVGE